MENSRVGAPGRKVRIELMYKGKVLQTVETEIPADQLESPMHQTFAQRLKRITDWQANEAARYRDLMALTERPSPDVFIDHSAAMRAMALAASKGMGLPPDYMAAAAAEVGKEAAARTIVRSALPSGRPTASHAANATLSAKKDDLGAEKGVMIGEFKFTEDVFKEGGKVGLAAVGSAATGGLWGGGEARKDSSFAGSKALADIGVTAVQLALPVGSLNAGARSVFYSGKGAVEAARVGKGEGLLLEDTFGGRILNKAEEFGLKMVGKPLPNAIWKIASGVFASNTKGNVTVFLRDPIPGSIWKAVEEPILSARKIGTIEK